MSEIPTNNNEGGTNVIQFADFIGKTKPNTNLKNDNNSLPSEFKEIHDFLQNHVKEVYLQVFISNIFTTLIHLLFLGNNNDMNLVKKVIKTKILPLLKNFELRHRSIQDITDSDIFLTELRPILMGLFQGDEFAKINSEIREFREDAIVARNMEIKESYDKIFRKAMFGVAIGILSILAIKGVQEYNNSEVNIENTKPILNN